MSVMHFKHDFNCGSAPLCGRVPAWADGTLKVENVTCKYCLKKIADGKSYEVLNR